jgi:hypothetical protein
MEQGKLFEIRTTGKTQVFCDEKGCGWSEYVDGLEGVMEWHRKVCPQCGQGVIVNDNDLALARQLKLFMDTANHLGNIPATGPTKEIGVTISTRPNQ